MEWECPVRVDRAVLPSVVSSLVQSGIKLFLHQRNQIPLPLEQLHQKRMEIQRQRQEEQQKDGLVDGHSKSQETEQPANDDLRERIQFMVIPTMQLATNTHFIELKPIMSFRSHKGKLTKAI